MSEHPVPRPAAACGIAAFVLIITGLVLSVAAGRPETTLASSPQEIAEAMVAPADAGVWVGVALGSLGLVAFLVFAAHLLEGRSGVARAAYGAAVACVAISVVALMLGGLMGELAGGRVDARSAVLLNDLWGGMYAASWVPIGAFLVLAAVALWDGGRLPRPVLVAAAIIGAISIAAVAAPTSSFGQAVALLPWLWIVVAGALLLRRAGRAPARARVTAAA